MQNQISDLSEELEFCTKVPNSVLSLNFNFEIETKLSINNEKIKFQLIAFEEFSVENKLEINDEIIFYFEKCKLEQKIGICFLLRKQKQLYAEIIELKLNL